MQAIRLRDANAEQIITLRSSSNLHQDETDATASPQMPLGRALLVIGRASRKSFSAAAAAAAATTLHDGVSATMAKAPAASLEQRALATIAAALAASPPPEKSDGDDNETISSIILPLAEQITKLSAVSASKSGGKPSASAPSHKPHRLLEWVLTAQRGAAKRAVETFTQQLLTNQAASYKKRQLSFLIAARHLLLWRAGELGQAVAARRGGRGHSRKSAGQSTQAEECLTSLLPLARALGPLLPAMARLGCGQPQTVLRVRASDCALTLAGCLGRVGRCGGSVNEASQESQQKHHQLQSPPPVSAPSLLSLSSLSTSASSSQLVLPGSKSMVSPAPSSKNVRGIVLMDEATGAEAAISHLDDGILSSSTSLLSPLSSSSSSSSSSLSPLSTKKSSHPVRSNDSIGSGVQACREALRCASPTLRRLLDTVRAWKQARCPLLSAGIVHCRELLTTGTASARNGGNIGDNHSCIDAVWESVAPYLCEERAPVLCGSANVRREAKAWAKRLLRSSRADDPASSKLADDNGNVDGQAMCVLALALVLGRPSSVSKATALLQASVHSRSTKPKHADASRNDDDNNNKSKERGRGSSDPASSENDINTGSDSLGLLVCRALLSALKSPTASLTWGSAGHSTTSHASTSAAPLAATLIHWVLVVSATSSPTPLPHGVYKAITTEMTVWARDVVTGHTRPSDLVGSLVARLMATDERFANSLLPLVQQQVKAQAAKSKVAPAGDVLARLFRIHAARLSERMPSAKDRGSALRFCADLSLSCLLGASAELRVEASRFVRAVGPNKAVPWLVAKLCGDTTNEGSNVDGDGAAEASAAAGILQALVCGRGRDAPAYISIGLEGCADDEDGSGPRSTSGVESLLAVIDCLRHGTHKALPWPFRKRGPAESPNGLLTPSDIQSSDAGSNSKTNTNSDSDSDGNIDQTIIDRVLDGVVSACFQRLTPQQWRGVMRGLLARMWAAPEDGLLLRVLTRAAPHLVRPDSSSSRSSSLGDEVLQIVLHRATTQRKLDEGVLQRGSPETVRMLLFARLGPLLVLNALPVELLDAQAAAATAVGDSSNNSSSSPFTPSRHALVRSVAAEVCTRIFSLYEYVEVKKLCVQLLCRFGCAFAAGTALSRLSTLARARDSGEESVLSIKLMLLSMCHMLAARPTEAIVLARGHQGLMPVAMTVLFSLLYWPVPAGDGEQAGKLVQQLQHGCIDCIAAFIAAALATEGHQGDSGSNSNNNNDTAVIPTWADPSDVLPTVLKFATDPSPSHAAADAGATRTPVFRVSPVATTPAPLPAAKAPLHKSGIAIIDEGDVPRHQQAGGDGPECPEVANYFDGRQRAWLVHGLLLHGGEATKASPGFRVCMVNVLLSCAKSLPVHSLALFSQRTTPVLVERALQVSSLLLQAGCLRVLFTVAFRLKGHPELRSCAQAMLNVAIEAIQHEDEQVHLSGLKLIGSLMAGVDNLFEDRPKELAACALHLNRLATGSPELEARQLAAKLASLAGLRG